MSVLTLITFFSCHSGIENFKEVPRLPSIFPDYTGIVVPPNIAPLNFRINEPGSEFEVRIYTNIEKPVIVRSSNPNIQIDIAKWHKLLEKGIGSKLYTDVFVKTKEAAGKNSNP